VARLENLIPSGATRIFVVGVLCSVAYWLLADTFMRPAEKIGVSSLVWLIAPALTAISLYFFSRTSLGHGWSIGHVALGFISIFGPFFGWTYLSQASFERAVQLELPVGTRGFQASIRAGGFHSSIDAGFEIPRISLTNFIATNVLKDGSSRFPSKSCGLPISNWTRGGVSDLDNPKDVAELKRIEKFVDGSNFARFLNLSCVAGVGDFLRIRASSASN
jgi:hypothetical protein